MKLNSIFVGKPAEILFKGKPVLSGINKLPVAGPVKVGKLNLEGDEQADLKVHGGADKAIYAYPAEHYAYWAAAQPQLQLVPGMVGENLSVSGFDEQQLRVSDILEIGTARFMVTVPRMPCYKLGVRVGDATFVKAFLDSRKTGFYLRVLQEGRISPGDTITCHSAGGSALTVDEVTRLYSTDKTNKPLLEKAVNQEHLPTDWRDFFAQRLDKLS